MSMKSYKVHYENKYPGADVRQSGEESLDVRYKGKHVVRLERDGSGSIRDVSAEYGCEGRHCLAPIPKNARARKLHVDGRIGNSEEHAERSAFGAELAKEHGHVPSIDELKKAGREFDDRGNLLPKKA